jgi:predicted permease
VADLPQDLRYGLRSLRLTPAFTAVALLVLALGIGVTTAMFSVVNGVLLRPLAYPEANRLVWTGFTWPSLHEELMLGGDYFEWREGNRTFEDIAAFGMSGTRGYDFFYRGEPRRIAGARVTGNFVNVLGVQPVIGRNFSSDEDRPGGPLALILSYPFWIKQFGGQVGAIGAKVVVDDQPYTVIGVMPKEFRFPGDLDFDVLLTQQLDAASQADRREGRVFHGIGRLKPGVTLAQARSDLDRLLADAHRRFPFFYRSDNRAVVVPLQEHDTGRVRPLLLVLSGAVGFVLLIACANVANLLLTRAARACSVNLLWRVQS